MPRREARRHAALALTPRYYARSILMRDDFISPISRLKTPRARRSMPRLPGNDDAFAAGFAPLLMVRSQPTMPAMQTPTIISRRGEKLRDAAALDYFQPPPENCRHFAK